MAAVNQNSGKKHCQVLLAVLILLVYCASNILDYDSGSFEVKSKSATPPPKKQQPYYPIEPGKYFSYISRAKLCGNASEILHPINFIQHFLIFDLFSSKDLNSKKNREIVVVDFKKELALRWILSLCRVKCMYY